MNCEKNKYEPENEITESSIINEVHSY